MKKIWKKQFLFHSLTYFYNSFCKGCFQMWKTKGKWRVSAKEIFLVFIIFVHMHPNWFNWMNFNQIILLVKTKFNNDFSVTWEELFFFSVHIFSIWGGKEEIKNIKYNMFTDLPLICLYSTKRRNYVEWSLLVIFHFS